MPCDCSHLEATEYERESRKVLGFLYEVGVNREKPSYYGNVDAIHSDTAKLCAWCKSNDIKEQSLELQIWWRDHQAADAAKLK